jgi:hypothetical protein
LAGTGLIKVDGSRKFNESETILTVQMGVIPFFALGFQVFSIILSTFF